MIKYVHMYMYVLLHHFDEVMYIIQIECTIFIHRLSTCIKIPMHFKKLDVQNDPIHNYKIRD